MASERVKNLFYVVGFVLTLGLIDLVPHIYNYFKQKKYKVKK